MFDQNETDKLRKWKEFRDSLEHSSTPFEDVALFWSNAPFVNNYLDPFNPKFWPDPWKLIIDHRFDELGIALGMCYTLQLTERFKGNQYEIHMSMPDTKKERRFVLLVDNDIALNWNFRTVANTNRLPSSLIKIWQR